jgi:hypothetical protein
MACRNALFEIEKVKQPALIAALPTHHDPTSSPNPSTKRNHDSPNISTPFSTASADSCRTHPQQKQQAILPSDRVPVTDLPSAA